MSKYLIGIGISAIIASLYTYFVGYASRQLFNVPSFYIVVLAIYAIQIIAFIPAAILNTEMFYDLSGSIGFITATVICLATEENLNGKQIVAGGMVLIWTFRLGGFLFYRIIKSKEDSRFKKIKESKIRFFMAWFIQALWVTITAGHIYSFLTQKPQQKAHTENIGVIQVIGIIVWSLGFLTQSTADFQKLLFNSDPKNHGKFIKSGLWKYSRHPNYCGQIILWLGSAIFVSRSLQGWQKLSLISPLFVYLLLTKLSGVPLLQAKADKKWGGTPQYEQYKSKTPIMFPWMPPTSSNIKNTGQKSS